MDPRDLARLLAIARIGVGTGLVVAPRLSGGLLLGRPGARAHVLARGFGARDMAIGWGMLRALNAGEPTRGWLGAGLASDVTDLLAAAAAGDDMPSLGRVAMMAAAATGTAAGGVLARTLPDAR